jgi:hypothetical protein
VYVRKVVIHRSYFVVVVDVLVDGDNDDDPVAFPVWFVVVAGGHSGSVGSGQSPGSGASLSAASAYTKKDGAVIATTAKVNVLIEKQSIFVFILQSILN